MPFFRKHKKLSENLYSSIDDLPIWNWTRVHDTGQLGYLLKEVKEDDRGDLQHLWDSMYDEYIKEFGVSEQYEKELVIRKKIGELQCQLIITEDKIIKSFIGAEQHYLDELRKIKKLTFEETIVEIEKTRPFAVNIKEMSVRRYYTYLKGSRRG